MYNTEGIYIRKWQEISQLKVDCEDNHHKTAQDNSKSSLQKGQLITAVIGLYVS